MTTIDVSDDCKWSQEIIKLVDIGVEYQHDIIWPTLTPPVDVEDTLSRFKPFQRQRRSWLNEENINQTLAGLVADRSDVTLVPSPGFLNAYMKGEASFLSLGGDIMLIPVCEVFHWFLISLHYQCRQVIVHESASRAGSGNFVIQCLREVWQQAAWTLIFRPVN